MHADAACIGLRCRYILLQSTPGQPLGMFLILNRETAAYSDSPQLAGLAPGGIAESCGELQIGDLISCVNGTRVRDHEQVARAAVAAQPPTPPGGVPLPKGCVRLQVLRAAPPRAPLESAVPAAAPATAEAAPSTPRDSSSSSSSSASAPSSQARSIRLAMENLKLAVRQVRVRVRGSEPGDALELGLDEMKMVTTDGDWKEMAKLSIVRDGDLVFKRVAIANITAHTESVSRQGDDKGGGKGGGGGGGNLARSCVADVESASLCVCKRLHAASHTWGKVTPRGLVRTQLSALIAAD